MEVIPRKDRVLLESFPDEVRNTPVNLKPTIIIPDCAKEPSRLAKVIAVGPECYEVSPGDTVLCNRYGGAEAKDSKGERYFLMKEEEILCRVM